MPRLLAVCLAALLLLAATASAQSPRIINGFDVPDGELPWTVALVHTGLSAFDGQFCGGTLVQDDGDDRDIVVTAAHCVEGETADSIEVVAGVTLLSAATDANYHAVESIAVLPGTTFPNPTLRGDLAIITLAEPATGVEPIGAIAAAGPVPAGPFRAAGWGEWTMPPAPTSFPDQLQYADLDAVSDPDCAAAWGTDFDAGSMVCALETAPTFRDACNGDSGGPLTTISADPTDGATWTLVGAVSFGSAECNDASAPGVYARLSAPALNAFVNRALDADPANDPVPQPEYVSGAPALGGTAVTGQTLTCSEGSVRFSGGDAANAVVVALSIVRTTDGSVVGGTSYQLTNADAGHRFACRARATVQNGGGSVTRQSASSVPIVPTPQVVTVPGPTVVQNVQVPVPVPTPQVDDTKAPKVSKVSRKCTKQRKCTFTVTTSDAEPSSGVTAMSATATMIRTRSCRKNGRRTVCARLTSRDLTVRRTSDGKFRVTTPKALPRGTHTLVLVAADGNGNVQAKPYRKSFRIR